MSILIDILRGHARTVPDKIAILADGEMITYGMLPGRIRLYAETIRAADPSDRPVGIHLPNGPEWILADLALLEMGRAAVPLPPFFLPKQIDAALANAGASSVIEKAGITRTGLPTVALPDGIAKISYTSGSTAEAKGIRLTEEQLIATARSVVGRLGAGRAGRHLPILPLGVLLENVAGLYASLIACGTYLAEDGAVLGLSNPFAPDFAVLIGRIADLRATSLILVPELLRGVVGELAAGGLGLPTVDLIAVGGARVSDGLVSAALAAGLTVVQGYGLTEAGSVVTIEDPADPVRGTAGRSLDHVYLSVATDGEILVARLNEAGAALAPPIATGDIGSLDAAGRLTITGRKSNLLITGHGRNISPEWVESELLGRPEIAQALVHGDGGASLSALIVPRSVEADPTAAVKYVNGSLPPYARIGDWELSRPFTTADGTLTTNGRPRRAAIMQRRAALPFFDRLVVQTTPARMRFQSVPQLRAGLRGEISLETYVAYLTQAYHHVRHTVPLMRAARDRLTTRPAIVAALDDYIEEESGHEHWILDDIVACGAMAEHAIAAGPSPATSAMVEHAYGTMRKGNPVAIFGMVFVLEGTSTAMADRGAEAIRARLGLPANAVRYLTSHGALDQQHMRFFETLVNGFDDGADQEAIVSMADEIFDLFGEIFAGIPMEQPHAFA